jgi:3-oxoacyl-[acyl-carrier protein] reductase
MVPEALHEKVALVTGGSRGIGAAIAKRLASLGAQVAINFRSDERAAREVADAIRRTGGTAEIFAGDVADPAAVKSMVAALIRAFGRIDVLVNNAGIFGMRPLGAIEPQFFAEQVRVNTLSVVLVTQEALPHFPATGGQVVNVASSLAYAPVAWTSVYAATEAAVMTLTQAFARELGGRRITVSAVAPSVTETDMTRAHLPERRQAWSRARRWVGSGSPRTSPTWSPSTRRTPPDGCRAGRSWSTAGRPEGVEIPRPQREVPRRCGRPAGLPLRPDRRRVSRPDVHRRVIDRPWSAQGVGGPRPVVHRPGTDVVTSAGTRSAAPAAA